MENCTVFTHYPGFDSILSLVRSLHPGATVRDGIEEGLKSITVTLKSGLLSPRRELILNYRQRLRPSYRLERSECTFTQNLLGMQGYIQSIQTPHKRIQSLLAEKAGTLNAGIAFIARPGFIPEFKTVLEKIVRETDGIIFAQPGKSFPESKLQHFLDSNLQLILDAAGESKVNELPVRISSTYFETAPPPDEGSVNLRAASEKVMLAKGIPFNGNLPLMAPPAQIKLRSKEELINRIYALGIIAALGEGVPRDQVETAIKRFTPIDFSRVELRLLKEKSLDEEDQAYATWRYESLAALQWAAGLLPALPWPVKICDVETVVANLLGQSRSELETKTELRSAAEIAAHADLIYCLDWACVDARVKGEKAPGELLESVIYERHYAFNWLMQYLGQDWDDVRTDT